MNHKDVACKIGTTCGSFKLTGNCDLINREQRGYTACT